MSSIHSELGVMREILPVKETSHELRYPVQQPGILPRIIWKQSSKCMKHRDGEIQHVVGVFA